MTKDEVFGKSASPSKVGVDSGSKFLGAVFLYMFIALAITALVATGLGALIQYLIDKGNAAGEEAVAIIFIVAFVLYIPTLIWVQFSCLRNGKSMIPGYVVYSIIMGVLISSFTVVIPFYELAITFGITCLAFGLMTLIGWFSKRDVSKLAIIGSGILIGSLFLICFNLILGAITGQVDVLNWIISFAVFFAIILITIVDLRNVKVMAANGGAERNVALLCALNLYVDFIYIFIRLLALIARARR